MIGCLYETCFFAAVHSSLDDYLAHWFGLNQSKYQWALDEYYENESLVSLYPYLAFFPYKVY